MGTPFELTVLGCSSATPTSKRYPTAQLLNIAERYFLIDCGEGTQIQLRRLHIRFQRISHIFISHLHGDHYLGLLGLLSSFHLLGRKKMLDIYHPPGLREIIEIQMQYSGTIFNYPIQWHQHRDDQQEILFEDESVSVETILLNHRIHCCGFLFREKPRPFSIDKNLADQYGVPIAQMQALRNGQDAVLPDGSIVSNHLVTRGRPDIRSYAYCSDTRYDERVLEQVRGVDLLYHEATFLHNLLERAKTTHHSTALEAGRLARLAQVKQLVIGHYSVRYKDLTPLLEEAQKEFENTLLAEEGKTYSIAEHWVVNKIPEV